MTAARIHHGDVLAWARTGWRDHDSDGAGMGYHGAAGHGGKHHVASDGTEEVEAWDCAPGCPVALLDAQAGTLHSRGNKKPTTTGGGMFGLPVVQSKIVGAYDAGGGPSRFFYCAKASRAERNAGCEGLPYERKGVLADDSYQRPADGRAGDTSRTIKGNHHPTVKPLDLVRHLALLLLPPRRPRRLLVPFAGSGSEMIGALQAGWQDVLGIEQAAEYIAIAQARIAYWTGQPPKRKRGPARHEEQAA